MNYQQIIQIAQNIINAIQNSALLVGREIKTIPTKVFSVRVSNPQTKVEVTGKVEVDQVKTQSGIKEVTTSVRELKTALKPLSSIRVLNFPKFPKIPPFPNFPKSISVSNMPKETRISNIDEFVNAIKTVNETVSKLNLSPEIKVAAPTVNVPAPVVNIPKAVPPQVNVEAPDLSELSKITDFLESIGVKKPLAVRLSDGAKFYKALEKMADIYAGSSFSAFQDSTGQNGRAILNRNNEILVTSEDTWILNDVQEGAGTDYLGKESVDGKWRVIKATQVGDYTTFRYASVRNNPTITTYEQAWADYENLIYDRISVAL